MIESAGDVVELVVMVALVVAGLRWFYIVSLQNKQKVMEHREKLYYRLLEESDTVFSEEEEEKNEPYYED